MQPPPLREGDGKNKNQCSRTQITPWMRPTANLRRSQQDNKTKQNMKPNLHRSGSKTTQSVPGVQNLCPDAAAHSILMRPDRVWAVLQNVEKSAVSSCLYPPYYFFFYRHCITFWDAFHCISAASAGCNTADWSLFWHCLANVSLNIYLDVNISKKMTI